jgi:hypothetical protein
MILVVDNNKKTYIEKYKLFYIASEAIEYANSLGFSKYSFIGISEQDLKPGVLHHVNAGKDCDVEVIEIKPETNVKANHDCIGQYGC